MSQKPAAENPGSDRELFTSRVLDAPHERVFRAFSDPAQLVRWWGPNVFVEVVPPERVVFNHVSGPRFEMTITFEAHDGKTVGRAAGS